MTSNENKKMDQLMKRVETLNGQIKIEMQNYKKKCEDQEKIISLVKKSLRTDKLEIDFEKYKKDTTMKIKSLEDEKLQIQNEKMLLQRKYDISLNELANVRFLHSSARISQSNLLKKTDDLSKQLEAEKALRIRAEDKVLSLESQIAMDKIVPKTGASQITSDKVVSTTWASQTLDKIIRKTQTNEVPVLHPITATSDAKSITVTNGNTRNNPMFKPSASNSLVTMIRMNRTNRKRKTNY